MNAQTLLLTAALLASTAAPVQLLVKESEDSTGCVQSGAGFSSREATARDVADDLRRYFGGLSVQATPLLDAAWHGRVQFCSPGAEALVDQALAQSVVRRAEGTVVDDEKLPNGAEELLAALASPTLTRELEATPAADPDEAMRKKKALAVVAAQFAAVQDENDVVTALDMAPSDKVGVHFRQHAAVYFLSRSDSAFADRLRCLRESLSSGSRVEFTFAVAGQILTSVRCPKAP